MPLLEAVLVDFDGTLVDSELANASAYASALEEFGFLKEASEIIRVIAGRHWSQFLPIIMGEHYSVEIGKNISELKREIYPTFYAEITLNLPLLSLLETLKKTIPIAIVSNSTRESIAIVLFNYSPIQWATLSKAMNPGNKVLVSGRPNYSKYDGGIEIFNPCFLLSDTLQNLNHIIQAEPVYPLTEGTQNKIYQKLFP